LDIIGHRDRDPKQIVGIQCKLKSGRSKLTKKEVAEHIDKALAYRPPLSEYFIVATSKDDEKLLPLAQEAMLAQQATGRTVHIEIWGWDTLQEQIDQHEAAKNAFDPGWSPSVEAQNIKLGILISGQKSQATAAQVAELTALVEKGAEARAGKLPVAFAERELKENLSQVLRRRGFARTDTAKELAELARRSIDGDLSLGSTSIRAEICDRAARANSTHGTIEEARNFRAAANALDSSRDLFIADAVLLEGAGDPDAALRKLRERKDPDTNSALFSTLMRQRGNEAALNWAREEQLGAFDFSPPGVINLVGVAIQNGAFEEARRALSAAPERYFNDCPALLLLRAQLTVAAILPEDRRAFLFQGLPLNPNERQLAGGATAALEIRRASTDLRALVGLIETLDLTFLKAFLTEFELWLRLEDPESEPDARAQLIRELSEPDTTLQRVRLALSYDVPFNEEALERTLQGRKEIGGWSPDERFAALLIAYHSDDRAKISSFIEVHHDDLFNQSDLSGTFLACLEIEALARLHRYADARKHVVLHANKELSPEQVKQLEDVIAHIEAGDEVDVHRQRYDQSHQLSDLRALVAGLRARSDVNGLAIFAPVLARATRTREDFGVAIRALHQSGRMTDIVQLTNDLPDLVALDEDFGSVKGFALYQLGRVMEARAIARDLVKTRGAANDRELAVVTAVETGDWSYIQGLLAQEIDRIETLEARDLLRLARLALEVNSTYVDAFRDAALRKAPDDPQVNLGAYVLATERGEEYRDIQVRDWFEKAVRLSGSDGPVQTVTMQDMVEHAAGWNEQAQNLDGMLRRAEIPLFVVAQTLRRQLIDLTLGLALRNTDTHDNRLPYPLFAFSGTTHSPRCEKNNRLALDITALITLDFLGLTDLVFEHFDRVVIAPSTLNTLFAERQFIRVQQPSRVQEAKRIRMLIDANKIRIANSLPEPPTETARDIGRELATLLTEARRAQGLVVRSAPVPKLGSFLEENADVSTYSAELTDTRSVLAFLTQSGKIDAPTRRAAEAYLAQVDVGWPSSKSPMPQSTLYLDNLAIHYLDHVGLLEPLTNAVAAVLVHPDLDQQTQKQLQYEKHTSDLLASIERIRLQISAGLQSGTVEFSARRARGSDELADEDDNSGFGASPSLDIMSDLTNIDIVVVDDRCLNKLPSWTDAAGKHASVGTTIDLITGLHISGQIDDPRYYELRHKLRAAGYAMMPIETEELTYHVTAAPIKGGLLLETPELAAVRTSLALAPISGAFTPIDEPWFNKIRLNIIRTIHALWSSSNDHASTRAQCTWLLSILPNPMAWCLAPDNDAVWAATRKITAMQVGYLIAYFEGKLEARRLFYEWVNEVYLETFQKMHPAIWEDAFALLKEFMLRLGE
jgi:hypothetical protein